MSQVWLGGLYLKEEGGYEIILRSLKHYRRRLKAIGRSPEIKDAPMFAQLVQYEASKAGPLVDQTITKVKEGLQNAEILASLESEITLFEKALSCYHADIKKLHSDAFYSELIQDKNTALSDLPKIQDALSKIKQYL